MKDSSHNTFANPFRPGAGHMPPHLAGREEDIAEIAKAFDQREVCGGVVPAQ